MTRYRNYWIYSIGCFVVWGVLLAVVAAKGKSDKTHTVLLVFAGRCIGWVSTTIARFVYPLRDAGFSQILQLPEAEGTLDPPAVGASCEASICSLMHVGLAPRFQSIPPFPALADRR